MTYTSIVGEEEVSTVCQIWHQGSNRKPGQQRVGADPGVHQDSKLEGGTTYHKR